MEPLCFVSKQTHSEPFHLGLIIIVAPPMETSPGDRRTGVAIRLLVSLEGFVIPLYKQIPLERTCRSLESHIFVKDARPNPCDAASHNAR